jgi:hypothetical protein
MFLVSTKGGAPIKMSKTSDDQPHPVWLDATTLVYMGTYGMFKVEIGSDGAPLQAPEDIGAGVSHAGLSWHGP